MAPPFPEASIKLDYPPYALDFDSQDANRLIVGGGGGAGRSGVGNKITVIESATENELRSAGEIELSRDEDSVMSLSLGTHKGKTAHLYAGVNSSPASIAKGKNEHLRTLAIEQSRVRSSTGDKSSPVKIAEVSRTCVFTDPDEGSYQRLVRVAGGVGAATSALGKKPQLAVFEATGAKPKVKGVMELPREAEDLDIIQTGDNQYQVAFCYKYELHLVNVGKEAGEPQLIYTMPEENSVRPAFRSVRWISSEFVLAVSNLPKRSGVIIQGLRLPKPGQDEARLAVTARIPRAISVTAMDVTNLTPRSSPTAAVGESQFVIAVAGHDASISTYTLELTTSGSITFLTKLYPLRTIHGSGNITALAFSTFISPKTHTRPQSIKLASTWLQQQAVAVHTIPLKKHIDKTPKNKKGPPRPVRYVVAMKSQAPSPKPLIIVLSIMVLIMAILGQGVMEMFGKSRPIIHAHKFLPSWHGTLRSPEYQPPPLMDEGPSEIPLEDSLGSSFAKLAGKDETLGEGETLVLFEATQTPGVGRDGGPAQVIQVDVHQEDVHGEAKTWEDLSEEQKDVWREKLSEAGLWTRDMGEDIFKGILFGQLAEAVGQAVGG